MTGCVFSFYYCLKTAEFMETFIQVLIDGMLSGMVYALVAAGLCLIWGVMDVINFAHGEYLMVAMYVSYWLGFLANVDPLLSIIAAGAFVFILGALTYKLIIRSPSANQGWWRCWRPSGSPCSLRTSA